MLVKQFWHSHRGFTILEVLVGMTVFTILIGIAIPAWNGLVPQVNLNSAAGQLYTDLNSARLRAMSQYRRVRVGFNSATSYTLEREQTPGAGDYLSLGSPKNLPTGITAAAAGFVIFDSRGRATIMTITLSNAAGSQKSVTIQPAGSIDIQ